MTEQATSGQINTDTAAAPAQAEGTTEATDTILTPEGQPGGDPESQASESAEGSETTASENEDGASDLPESYEFNMPEGMEIDQTLADEASVIFKELKLNQDQADKFTKVVSDLRTREAEKAAESFTKQLNDWKEDLKTDAEFGGDAFDENAGKVSEFIQKTAPDGVKDDLMGLLTQTGIGNHPAMVKYIFALSKQFPVGEDNPGSGGAVGNRGKDRAERMYPNS